MKGPIEDPTVLVEPSKALIDFINSLEGDQALPENVIKIRKSNNIKTKSKEIFTDRIPKKVLTEKQRELLTSLRSKDDFNSCFKIEGILDDNDEGIETLGSDGNEKSNKKLDEKKDQSSSKSKQSGKDSTKTVTLNINDLRWIEQELEKRRVEEGGEIYLHELLVDSQIILPENKIVPRNPELEARCAKLREEQQERDYRNMTKDVDATRQHLPEDTIAYQVKSINRQLVAVFQFVVSVITGFVFGFIGLQLMFGDLDFGFRLFMGVMCALIIALAEIYFLAKKLAEYDEPIADIPMPKPKIHPHQD